MINVLFFCCEDHLGSIKHSSCNSSNQKTKIILIREEKQNQSRSSHGRCSVKRGVLLNFAKFTGKHLFQILVFNKVAGGSYVIPTYTLLAPIRKKSNKTQKCVPHSSRFSSLESLTRSCGNEDNLIGIIMSSSQTRPNRNKGQNTLCD